MLIDWFTVGAQMLNFAILVWLLKRFLYRPILTAVDSREQRIAAELADAGLKRTEAAHERDDFLLKNEEFDRQRAALLSKAAAEAGAERQRLLDEGRRAAEVLSAGRLAALRSEARDLHQSIMRRTEQEVFAIAKRALADLAAASLEERIGEVFVQRVRAMDRDTKKALAAALGAASEPAVVRSAFELSEPQRLSLQKALSETFAAEVRLRFELASELIGGIELKFGGQKLGWSIADYLGALEKDVGELLPAAVRRGDEVSSPSTEPAAGAARR